MTESSRIVVAVGAWAVERRLLAEIELALPLGLVPAAPVVVLVPSHSLREHLLGRLAHRRPAWLGLEVVTLAGVAAEILRRTGPVLRSGAVLMPILVRRLAARESALAKALGGLEQGYDEIGGAVRDLLDAGFVEEHIEAVEERLALERGTVGGGVLARAVATVRVAAGVRRELEAVGLVTQGDLLAAATQRLALDPDRALPASALFVHGFVDLTGVGTDLLAAIVRHRPTTLLLDAPPELDGSRSDWRFGRRLLERLRGLAAIEQNREETSTPGSSGVPCVAFRAADPAREARAAIGWLARSAATVEPEPFAPEDCALVARELDGAPGVLGEWCRELERQGVPYSAENGPPTALARRAIGLLELLERGAEAPVGVALELARERIEVVSGAPIADLRLALALLGARTLGAATGLAARSHSLQLPVADRFATEGERCGRTVARSVAPAALERLTRELRALRAELEAMRRPRPLDEQLRALRRLLARALSPADAILLAAPLVDLAAGLSRFEVDAEEWRTLVAAAWRESLRSRLGAGGGVALLSVTEARGRTFERLALVGLERDRFPRAVRPDALFPDALRLRLRDLLPDLPVKAEGHDEERFLFAQLVAAARDLALFRSVADGQGRPRPPSPFLDELLRGSALEELRAPEAERTSALDHAVVCALRGDAGALAPSLTAALAEARDRFAAADEGDPAAVARARLALLDLRAGHPGRADARQLGAFFGTVGALEVGSAGVPAMPDPRRAPPSVTTLERLAGCGWRLFLERLLRLNALPDLVESLPTLPRRLAGNVVHHVLEGLLPGARGSALDELLSVPSHESTWPSPEELAARVRAAAYAELAHEALDPTLFESTLARQALDLLEIARAIDWPDGRRELLGVEVKGEAAVEANGVRRRIGFRVDRVERLSDELLLTDYKTGRALSKAVKPVTRARHLTEAIASGEALQLPVYLLGVGEGRARARYLFLHPKIDERARELALGRSGLAGAALESASFTAPFDTLFAAWDAGAFVPRLTEPDLRTIWRGCASCEVREACVQGDSAARGRFERWAQSAPADEPWERAARSWWQLTQRPAAAAGGGDE